MIHYTSQLANAVGKNNDVMVILPIHAEDKYFEPYIRLSKISALLNALMSISALISVMPTKLLVCATEYHPYGSGIANVVYNVVEHLKEQGVECTVCSPTGPDIKLGSLKLIEKTG
ncbi:MAG: hypothetical protein ACOYCB_12880, partial [Fastidiosipilaceae bacterium]